MTIYTWEYSAIRNGQPVEFSIVYDSSLATDNITVTVTEGSLELNQLWFSDGDATANEINDTSLSDPQLLMNGTGLVWDGYQFIDGAGLGGDLTYFLSAEDSDATNDSLTLTADANFLSFIANSGGDTSKLILGVRATSVNGEFGPTASLKLYDTPDTPDGGNGGEPVCYDGLSQGYWSAANRSGLVHASDWTHTDYSTGEFYDTVFGINAFSSTLNDKTLVQAISTGGGGEAALARQAVAAILNATSDGTIGTLTEGYRFSVDDIIDAVQKVYDGGSFDAAHAAQLQNLLEFWNIVPEKNLADGATMPGELCSNDATEFATLLWFDKDGDTIQDSAASLQDLYGGSFTGDIFTVLDNLYGGDYWV